MAVHQHAVPSGCQKEHRIFYAHIYIRSRRTNQLTFWKCYIFTYFYIFLQVWSIVYVRTALWTIYTKVFSAHVSWMKPTEWEWLYTARQNADSIQRRSQQKSLLSWHSTAYTTESAYLIVSFFIECQPGVAGWSYCKKHLPISTLFAFNV